MPTKNDVIRLNKSHPNWSSIRIAEELGCRPEYVRATMRRSGLTLRTGEVMALGKKCKELGLSLDDLETLASLKKRGR